MLAAFSLVPTDAQFYAIEELCRASTSPVTEDPTPSAGIDTQLYCSLLELLACLRPPDLLPHVAWDNGLKAAAVRRLEEVGMRYNATRQTFSAVDKSAELRYGRPTKTAAVADEVGVVDGKRESHSGSAGAPSAVGFTLDDIQQVLSAANCPLPTTGLVSVASGQTPATDTSVDERALREITAYLQSEIGGSKVAQDPTNRCDFAAYNSSGNSGGTLANHDPNVLVRLIPPPTAAATAADVHHTAKSREDARPLAEGSPGAGGGTILVTDSNLPYLQQFLPNLQTVMQSVQSLVRSVPQSAASEPDIAANSVASTPAQRCVSLPSLVLSNNTDSHAEPSSNPKKRKRGSHAGHSKLHTSHLTVSGHSKQDGNLAADSFVAPLKDGAASKYGDAAPAGKVEADCGVTSAGDGGGFSCVFCSRTFSKRLGLSVHIQRAHGHRRSADSADVAHDTCAPTPHVADKLALEDGGVKNCYVKIARPAVEGRGVLPDVLLAAHADMTGTGPPAGSAAAGVCMCDGCGELVTALDLHAAVCTGRHSPAKPPAPGAGLHDNKPESVVPAASTNTAVAEMLQLAEHFLRQHIPITAAHGTESNLEPVHLMSAAPPVYSDSAPTIADVIPSVATGGGRFAVNGQADLASVSAHGLGKEIMYEGTQMREFVEYQCEACLLTFSSSALANTHVTDHHSSASISAYRVYACLSCALRYRDPRIMRHHVVYLCGGSGQAPLDAAAKHQLFPCSFCTKTFMSSDYMELHVRLRHSGQQLSAVPCVLPTPPGATSVPSLDELVSQFRRQPLVSAGQATPTGAMSASGAEPRANHKAGFVVPSQGTSLEAVDSSKAGTRMPSAADGNPTALGCEGGKARSSKAKGILYKNVFMQCEGTYSCSVCHADLTGRESKRRHRQLPCGDPKTASYSRRYSYVCPYCSERFPSQKLCRQHQIDECLPLIGVGTAELGVGEYRCPLCPKTCFGFPALKGHITQAHHLAKHEVTKLLSEHELVGTSGAPLVPDSSQEFNGVLSPGLSSPSSSLSTTTSAGMVLQAAASPAVHSLYETANMSRTDGVDSDDDIPEPEQSKELFPQLYESVVTDEAHQPSEDTNRPKRNRKTRSNEFFVMMFRNYPILAKGVSMCRSCGTQLDASMTAESHAGSCTATAAADVRRSTLFRCTHCTASFWRAKDCRTHQLESCLPAHGVKVERLTEPSVACPMCEVRSYNRSGLMSHMKFRHSLDTDGVRQVMDRCGIRKSVPPTADNLVTSSPQECEDGLLSMDEVGLQCGGTGAGAATCDGLQSLQCISDGRTDDLSDSVTSCGQEPTQTDLLTLRTPSASDVSTDLNN